MAGSVNKVILVGNLGADPEVCRTRDGRLIANLRVATSESWRDKATGERKERTEWHRVVVFNEGAAKFAEQYLKKGMKVYVEGQLATRKWTDKEGIERYSTEIIFNFNGSLQSLEKVEGRQQSIDDYGMTRTREQAGDHGSQRQPPYGGGSGSARSYKRDEINDEIPFSPEWRA